MELKPDTCVSLQYQGLPSSQGLHNINYLLDIYEPSTMYLRQVADFNTDIYILKRHNL